MDLKYLESDEMLVYPIHFDLDSIDTITTIFEWERFVEGVREYLDRSGVIDMGRDELLLKVGNVYGKCVNVYSKEMVQRRDELGYIVVNERNEIDWRFLMEGMYEGGVEPSRITDQLVLTFAAKNSGELGVHLKKELGRMIEERYL